MDIRIHYDSQLAQNHFTKRNLTVIQIVLQSLELIHAKTINAAIAPDRYFDQPGHLLSHRCAHEQALVSKFSIECTEKTG